MGDDMIIFDTYENFKKHLNEYEKQSTSHFITMKKEKSFSHTEWKCKRLHWKDNLEERCSFPYVIVGQLLLGCHQGRDKNVGRKEKYRQTMEEKRQNSGGKIRRRFMTQSTKKLDCPAIIAIKKIARFPDFKEEMHCSPWTRRKTVKEFTQYVKAGNEVKTIFEYWAKFPGPDGHENHIQGEFAGMREPIDPVIRKKVEDLVKSGMTQVPDIQKFIRSYVVNELFAGQAPPSTVRRRYHPNKRDILNISYVTRTKHRGKRKKGTAKSAESLAELTRSWVEAYPNDRIFIPDIQESSHGAESVSHGPVGSDSKLLFCHQTQNQQRLLNRYGSLLVVDKVRLRTKLSAVPVFLYVRTNVDFQLVGEFVMKNDDIESLEEGLKRIQEWNPGWKPEYFVTDIDERMMGVVKKVFPECAVFSSSYHMEKLLEWCVHEEMGLQQPLKSTTMDLIRKVAKATTRDQMAKALETLQLSEGWILSEKLQAWFTENLALQHSWVAAFWPEKLCVLLYAMNGPEKLTTLLKTDHLEPFLVSTLYDLVKVLVTSVVPDFYRRYITSNIRGSKSYGKMHHSLPQYLEDRPQDLVMHIRSHYPASQALIDNVVQLENGTFTLPRDLRKPAHTQVSFGDEKTYPSCQCLDWLCNRLPCRHFLAVFHHLGDLNPWEHLSPLYRNNPMFSVDQECVTQQMTAKALTSVKVNVAPRVKADTSIKILQEMATGTTPVETTAEMSSGQGPGSGKSLEDLSNAALESIAYHFLANNRSGSASREANESGEEATAMDTSSATKTPAKSQAASADGKTLSPPEQIPSTSKPDASNAQINPETIVNMAETALLDASQATGALKHLQTLRVLKHTVGLQLKQLTEGIPTITDEAVLERVVQHVEAALREVRSSAGS